MNVSARTDEPRLDQEEQQIEPFLIVPYYGAADHTSYMDNDKPDYGINGKILLYNQQVIAASNGVCGYNHADVGIAYYSEPNARGDCIWYEGHAGHDFAVGFIPGVQDGYGPVLAAAAGTVRRARWTSVRNRHEGLGLFIELEHANGYLTRYGHMSAVLTPTLGLKIPAGYLIGTSGSTGNVTGPHLHFEVVDDQRAYVDPFSTTAYLWREGTWNADGQWSGRQSQPSYNITYVIDNHDTTFQKGRYVGTTVLPCPSAACPSWWTQTSGGLGNGDFLWTYRSDYREYWATWTTPQAGYYLVEAYIPALNAIAVSSSPTTTITWGALYCPSNPENGASLFNCMLVDQLQSVGHWIALGMFQFASFRPSMILTDEALLPEPFEQAIVGVDALRFRGVILDKAVYLPTVQSATSVVAAHEPP